MKKHHRSFLSLLALAAVAPAFAMEEADPFLTSVWVDQMEYRNNDGEDSGALEANLWAGRDLNKLWFKVEAEKEPEEKSLELQALYSKAIAPYWDLQLGVRQDFEPEPERSWAVLGIQGLAPYFFEVDAALFIGESGRSALRLGAEYELLITQRLILSPEVELNLYGEDDPELHLGSGLANAEAGLRLRYEIRREFAPYVGVHWARSFGDTADLLEADGEDRSETQWVIGLRAWL
ncbi:copper resistance protein B [Proteobacteria bacterium 005FR1]|nr:copper resistance protein B [Proteobacteria bacterium 005FR1]